ncbi:MAG TPA: serine hydrolase domain-containing protein [Pelovirga sp.]|nr:serine hydrolase domain-containing protein [Pelovirga sp.]
MLIARSRWLGSKLQQFTAQTSGLPDHVHLENLVNSIAHQWQETQNLYSPEDLIEYNLYRPALFEAGTSWAYSGTGYILIGLVIEEVTGRNYYEEVKECFLTPFDLLAASTL